MPGACEYCDVFAGVATSRAIAYDDGTFVAFIGRFQPTGPGYVLAVPRAHVRDLHDVADVDLAATLGFVQRVSRAVVAGFGVTGTTILQNNGPPGQRVPHLHFHVVPRREGDGYPCSTDDEVPVEELRRQADVLALHLGG